jgi:hypothetical protein
MTPTITFDYRTFNAAFERRLVQWGGDVKEAIRQEAKLLARNCVGFTPPTTRSPKVDVAAWAKQKKAGEAAIEKDIQKIFIPVSQVAEKFNDRALGARIKKYAEGGETDKIEAVFKDLKIKGKLLKEADLETHSKSRGASGRTLKRFYIIEIEKSIKALAALLKKRVGFAKAGWKSAAQSLGVTLPNWITRHNAPGSIQIRMNTENPSITIENAVPYAQKHNATAHVIQRALNLSAENLTKRLNATMGKTFRKK